MSESFHPNDDTDGGAAPAAASTSQESLDASTVAAAEAAAEAAPEAEAVQASPFSGNCPTNPR